MTEQEYREEIASLAAELIEEAKAERWDSEDIQRWIHETIDGHQFVIYTAKAQDVLRHSRNDGAAADNFGGESCADKNGVKWEFMAYCAMEADLYEELSRRDFDVNAPDYDEGDEDESEDS